MEYREKKLVYRGGLIPYIVENGEVQMMFMKPSDPEYGGDLFQIAKGKVEDGETNAEAALREAKEEIGLFGGNVIRTDEVGNFMGRTAVFVSKIKDKNMFGEPSFETSETKWMSIDEFIEDGRTLHVPVVKAAYRKIIKLEGIDDDRFSSID